MLAQFTTFCFDREEMCVAVNRRRERCVDEWLLNAAASDEAVSEVVIVKTNSGEAVEKNDCNQRDFNKLSELIQRGQCACFPITGPLICPEGRTTQERDVKTFRHTTPAKYFQGELSFNGAKHKKTKKQNWK